MTTREKLCRVCGRRPAEFKVWENRGRGGKEKKPVGDLCATCLGYSVQAWGTAIGSEKLTP